MRKEITMVDSMMARAKCSVWRLLGGSVGLAHSCQPVQCLATKEKEPNKPGL